MQFNTNHINQINFTIRISEPRMFRKDCSIPVILLNDINVISARKAIRYNRTNAKFHNNINEMIKKVKITIK